MPRPEDDGSRRWLREHGTERTPPAPPEDDGDDGSRRFLREREAADPAPPTEGKGKTARAYSKRAERRK